MRTAKSDFVFSLKKKSANEIAEDIKTTGGDFLRSTAWRELRAKVLEKYGAKCMCCGYTSDNTRRIHVDHVKPRKFYPELALSFENLQVLCGLCNKDKGNKHMTDYRQPMGI